MCTTTLGDGNDVNMVIRPKAEVVLLGAMVTHALIWMVGLKSCALDVPFVRENTHSSRNLVTCDQALFFSRRCGQRKNERLIQLLVESSVKSPESGLFSDWSGNKRQHKAKS